MNTLALQLMQKIKKHYKKSSNKGDMYLTALVNDVMVFTIRDRQYLTGHYLEEMMQDYLFIVNNNDSYLTDMNLYELILWDFVEDVMNAPCDRTTFDVINILLRRKIDFELVEKLRRKYNRCVYELDLNLDTYETY